MTIQDWFNTNLNATNVVVDGMEAWGKQECVRAYLPVDVDGSLFVSCGGHCIMAFETPAINRRPVYLVVEPSYYRKDDGKRDRLVLHQSA